MGAFVFGGCKIYTFTLEWNAVTTLEDESREGRSDLIELVKLHGKKIDLGIVTTAASENTKENRTFPKTAKEFDLRLQEVGLGHLTRVLTMCCYDLTYWGYCRLARDEDLIRVDGLWRIIKPKGIARHHRDFAIEKGIQPDADLWSPEYYRWRNKWCDVYSIDAHIAAKRDVFATDDFKNFKGDARSQLEALGVGHICRYSEALKLAQQ